MLAEAGLPCQICQSLILQAQIHSPKVESYAGFSCACEEDNNFAAIELTNTVPRLILALYPNENAQCIRTITWLLKYPKEVNSEYEAISGQKDIQATKEHTERVDVNIKSARESIKIRPVIDGNNALEGKNYL